MSTSRPEYPASETPRDLIDLVYETATTVTGWDQFLAVLGQALGNARPILTVHDADHGHLYFTATSGYVMQSETRDASRFIARDADQPGTFTSCAQFVATRRFVALDDQYAITLRVRETPDCLFSATVQYRVLETVAPHILRALRVERTIAVATAHQETRMAVLDCMPFGVVFVSPELRPLFANRYAQSLLQRRDGLLLVNNTLDTHHVEDREALRDAVSRVYGMVEQNRQSETRLNVHRAVGRRELSVVVTSAPSYADDLPPEQGNVLAVLVITDADRDLDIAPEILFDLYQLTPAEADLALAIANGRSLSEIATDRGVALGTVRTQLKRIYSKTDTHRQSALVKLILLGPAGWVAGDLLRSPTRDQSAASETRAGIDTGSGR